MSGYLKQHTGTVELTLNFVFPRVVGRVEAGGLLVCWRSGLVDRPGLPRSAGVVGGFGSVDDCGVSWSLLVTLVRMRRTTEGSPGWPVRSGRPGGSCVELLGIKIQKPTERAVGIRLGKRVDYKQRFE